ncbi:hypothetical protein [Pseudorhodoferax soli]|uniref:Uncharacterized protein n=1 Tax=Pseudorhodoferax soli TaxID=545864 RepID=A0A368XPS0_9BURK|nr:hypothetical protein [Pseudorhodoferax soli]RCW68517.1 hypothetical protein DES41_10738 [Pseudorhodoferax soli]
MSSHPRAVYVAPMIDRTTLPGYGSIDRVRPGDLKSLIRAVRQTGLETEEVEALRVAAMADARSDRPDNGFCMTRWFSGMRVKCAHGLCDVTTQTLVWIINPMLHRYISNLSINIRYA